MGGEWWEGVLGLRRVEMRSENVEGRVQGNERIWSREL